MAEEACCTCATLLSNITPLYDERSEKPTALDRRLDCCGRVICASCIYVCHSTMPVLPNSNSNNNRIIPALEHTVRSAKSPRIPKTATIHHAAPRTLLPPTRTPSSPPTPPSPNLSNSNLHQTPSPLPPQTTSSTSSTTTPIPSYPYPYGTMFPSLPSDALTV
jgi:hypothetical protein